MRPALRGFIEPADEAHEAVRDLVRARDAAFEAQKQARQQLHSFLLRHGRYYTGRKAWTRAHGRWLASQAFEHPAHQILLAEYCQAVEDAGVRLDRLGKLIGETPASWSMAPAVAAYQAMRGVAFMTAVTLVVEIGDIRRFDSARQLMAYLGLVPSESSTGERVRRGGITKAGNARARRALIEGAWTYRYPARISPVPSGVKVWLATGYTDMRRGFPGLSLMVQERLKRSDERPSVRLPGPERPITNILHTVFVLRRSHILGIRCSGERCRSRRIGAARA
ncbi:transposase [Sinorhizobium medicae]